MPHITALGYIRVSTSKQVADGLSLDAQQQKIQAYAELYDLDIMTIEVDEGLSAKTLLRPGLQHALARLKAGEARALPVCRLDRLTRSVRDLGELIATYFASGHRELLSVSEQIDTRSAGGRLVLNVLGSVSQWERETIGERTAEAMAYKRQLREYCGGDVPYGWQIAADGEHIEPYGLEQVVIKEALRLRQTGASLRTIGTVLEHQGWLPRDGGRWHPTTVKRLLSREAA
jgi:DNA invertase Pin-like site-specific DNA recombinase